MSGKNILIVADEARAAEKVAILLEQLGYSVSAVVDTPLDAFAHADAAKLDMALVDIQIEGDLTGIDIARRFHAEYDVPVILLLPRVDPETLAKAAAAEACGYIVRPFHRSTLAATMNKAFQDRNSRWYEARVRHLEMEFEDKVRERTASLEASNQALSVFVMSVAHDLRTPLRAINGYASRLMEELEETLPDEGRRLLTNVLTSASRLGDLVEGYLRLSRLSTAGLRKQDVDMNRLAHEAWAEVMAGEMQAPRLSITCVPSVRGDESLLRQVWVNLFSNAVKFSRLSPAPQVEVAARDAGDVIRFRVQDNGVGFDPLYCDRLFRPLERLHAQSEFEGNGMGLSIVQQILRRHGGDVSIKASVGKGAAVEFWLPKE